MKFFHNYNIYKELIFEICNLLCCIATRIRVFVLQVCFAKTRIRVFILQACFAKTRIRVFILQVCFAKTRIRVFMLHACFAKTRIRVNKNTVFDPRRSDDDSAVKHSGHRPCRLSILML